MTSFGKMSKLLSHSNWSQAWSFNFCMLKALPSAAHFPWMKTKLNLCIYLDSRVQILIILNVLHLLLLPPSIRLNFTTQWPLCYFSWCTKASPCVKRNFPYKSSSQLICGSLILMDSLTVDNNNNCMCVMPNRLLCGSFGWHSILCWTNI